MSERRASVYSLGALVTGLPRCYAVDCGRYATWCAMPHDLSEKARHCCDGEVPDAEDYWRYRDLTEKRVAWAIRQLEIMAGANEDEVDLYHSRAAERVDAFHKAKG